MLKQLLFILFTSGFISPIVYANTITVKVTNIKTDKGVIHIGFYKPNEDFPNHKAKHIKKSVKVSKGQVQLTVSDLDAGVYAVAVLHDINNNDKLDKNFFGIPKEPYGFSRNIHHKFSAPTFNECKFSLTDKPVALSINLKH